MGDIMSNWIINKGLLRAPENQKFHIYCDRKIIGKKFI